MSEIAKEVQENKEPVNTEQINVPEIKPKGDFTSEQADALYDKIIDDAYFTNNDVGQNEESIENEDLYDKIYNRDIDEFNFDEFDLDNESLEKILEYFNPEKWEKLDLDDKEAVIRAFESYLAKVLDLKNPPKVIFYYGPQGECGGYSRSDNIIRINANTIDDPKMAISTIAHETWHAYQHQRAENPQTTKDKLYIINFENYISPQLVDGNWIMFEEYESQLVEAEANAFGRLFEEKVGGK